jgi:hypothetical protein
VSIGVISEVCSVDDRLTTGEGDDEEEEGADVAVPGNDDCSYAWVTIIAHTWNTGRHKGGGREG